MKCLRTLLRIYEQKSSPKKLKTKKFFGCPKLPTLTKQKVFLGHNSIGILYKLVHLEASTKPHVHQKFEMFWTNIASTMACPMSKNGPKKGLRPLGVNVVTTH
jgi:hypothetical protein